MDMTVRKVRIDKQTVLQLSQAVQGYQRDESAIPAYTHWNPLVRWIMFRRLDVLVRMVREVIRAVDHGAPTALLDFGCGVGILFRYVFPQVTQLYGTDLCLDAVRSTVAHYECPNVSLYPPDTVFSEIPGHSLDAIVAADVLEHVDDLPGILEQFSQKLKPTGALLISGPTESFVYGVCRKIAGFTGEYHVRNIFDIEQMVERSEFVHQQTVALPFPILPKLFRISVFRPQPSKNRL